MIACQNFILLETLRNFFYELRSFEELYILVKLVFLIILVGATYFFNNIQPSGINAKLTYLWFFLLLILVMAIQTPNFMVWHIHDDESQHIAEGLTLAENPAFWKSVDGTTVGPIAIYLVAAIKWLGFPVYFHSIRILNILLWFIISIFIYRIFRLKFGVAESRVLTLPVFILYPLFFHSEYISYNGEISAALLITITTYGIIRYFQQPDKRLLILIGFLLVLLPFTKIQVGLAAFLIGIFLLIRVRKSTSNVFYLLLGVAIPFFAVLIYLLSTNTFMDFWQSYIINNIFYTVSGVGLEAKRGFLMNIFKYAFIIVKVKETRIIFFYAHIFFLIYLFNFLKNKEFKDETKHSDLYLLLLFLLIAIVVIFPGNLFPHYAIMLIPASLLIIGFFYAMYARKILIGFQNEVFILLFVVIPGLVNLSSNVLFAEQAESREEYAEILEISDQLCELKKPDDRMALWGWTNQLYPEANLMMGTREAHTQRQILAEDQQEYYISRYLIDLEKNKPAFFVDTTERDTWIFDYEKHNYRNFPRIYQYINEHYEFVIEIFGAEIYKRNR